MRQIVAKTFGRPINIELLEKLQLPPSSGNANNSPNQTTTLTNQTQLTNANVFVNQSLLSQQQQHRSPIPQQPLCTTVQPQQKINLLQQTPPSAGSLLGQQQQQQQQARAQIVRFAFLSLSRENNNNNNNHI